MRDWPDADLIIMDETHTQMKVWTEHIQTCRAAVIGLSATPFSAGVGKLYSNLLNATTMAERTESAVLVPIHATAAVQREERADGEQTIDHRAGAEPQRHSTKIGGRPCEQMP